MMRRRGASLHLGLLVLAAALGLVGIRLTGRLRPQAGASGITRARACVDATGRTVRCGGYRRVVSGSLLADQLLDELVERDRIVAYSIHGADTLRAHRYADRPRVDPNGDVERLLALHPDLLLVNHFLEPGKRRRIEEAGVVVFDLGPMRGVVTLLADVESVGRLLDVEARAERTAATFRRRLETVAADVPREGRPRAAYLAVHGTQIYGGTRGTSFHDVLLAAGLEDAEARSYEGWPELTSEAILALDPDVVVTTRGRRGFLCEHPGLAALRACRPGGRVIELEHGIADDPGFGMLEAAELLHEAVHHPPGSGPR